MQMGNVETVFDPVPHAVQHPSQVNHWGKLDWLRLENDGTGFKYTILCEKLLIVTLNLHIYVAISVNKGPR